MKNHIMVAVSYLNNGEIEQAKNYLSDVLDNLNKTYSYIQTGNSVMNYIINSKLEKALLPLSVLSIGRTSLLCDIPLGSIQGRICWGRSIVRQECPAIYGGVITAIVTVFVFSRGHKYCPWVLLWENTGLGLVLGQVISQVGKFF